MTTAWIIIGISVLVAGIFVWFIELGSTSHFVDDDRPPSQRD